MIDFDHKDDLEPLSPEEIPEIIESIQWAVWEACARSYGHSNEVEMRQKYEEWKDGRG